METSNFIKTIIEDDIKSGKHKKILTRFPPEPNGYLHIGHARAIVTNFELAKHFNGKTNLRYDDTNPEKEEEKYVKAIKEDIEWLGYKPDKILFASNYFDKMYERTELLVKKGLAFVCELSAEQLREYHGDVSTPGKNSPYRDRSVDENLKLFRQMKAGLHPEGSMVLRAKIDMASPNMNMRDPVIYRISFAEHHNTKDKWKIYPMYAYAHPLEDAIEGITHSLCSLEFEDLRPLYDWTVYNCEMKDVPRQIEFGRLGIENTVMSKRYLKHLVDSGLVTGWDDPRMPTLCGLRKRGYSPTAIKNFILATGLSKINSTVSQDMLDSFVRDDLALTAKRVMAVLNPLKVTITNYPKDQVESIDVAYYQSEGSQTRKVFFSKNIYIEKDDFVIEKPDKKYKRLSIGGEVRLFHAYFIKAYDVIKDEKGDVVEVLATYDVNTKSGSGFNERKPDGTIHFVEATTAQAAKFNIFEPMLIDDEKLALEDRFNHNSWTIKDGFVEAALKESKVSDKFQFIRNGYFSRDDDVDGELNFNEVVKLKSSYK